MPHDLTHASFFSGVGGLDLGLERAGWRTVSFSEIDPYASAVLAERWPGVPNLGDIVELRSDDLAGSGTTPDIGAAAKDRDGTHRGCRLGASGTATLWSGGFPCQDLSVAGKRRGFTGERSSLAFAFLDLVERHRPPAILLENVPGLLSSHRGRDMAALLGRLVELGYGVAYRTLDARYFGVPQRRRRVFILGLRSDPDDPDGRAAAERAAEVLAVGTRCRRHPPTGVETGEEPADGTRVGVDFVGAIPAGQHGFPDGVQEFMQGHFRVVGPAPDPGGVRAPDGLAGRTHHRQELEGAPVDAYAMEPGNSGADRSGRGAGPEAGAAPLSADRMRDVRRGREVVAGPSGRQPPEQRPDERHDPLSTLPYDDGVASGRLSAEAEADHRPGTEGPYHGHAAVFKGKRAQSVDDDESWRADDVNPTVNGFDVGDARATTLVAGTLNSGGNDGGFRTEPGEHLAIGRSGMIADPLLPIGLDSHRYRACGNGVVSSVAEWIGQRLVHELQGNGL